MAGISSPPLAPLALAQPCYHIHRRGQSLDRDTPTSWMPLWRYGASFGSSPPLTAPALHSSLRVQRARDTVVLSGHTDPASRDAARHRILDSAPHPGYGPRSSCGLTDLSSAWKGDGTAMADG